VRDSTFTDIAIDGIWIACSSDLLIEKNVFSTSASGYSALGIQGDAPISGAVSGVIIRDNTIHALDYGIQFRVILGSSITNNQITHNQHWGIMVLQSKACYPDGAEPGWVCFNSTTDTISDNFVLGNTADLYHDPLISGNTWARNICRIKVGAEIPDCISPSTHYLPLILLPLNP
jgi:nitrous oxidase accessory protein NosD